MRKTAVLLVLSLFLFVSCTTTSNANRVEVLDKMGKDGSIVLTADGEYLKIDKVDRISAELQGSSINGFVEGNFSKLIGYIATTNVDLSSYGIVTEDMDYYQPSRGLIAFSKTDAKGYYDSVISNNTTYIDTIDLELMKQSDFALYSKDLFLLYAKDDYWSANIYGNDESSTRSLFSAIKSSYISYLTVHNIPFDIKELIGKFYQNNCTINIVNLPLNNGYLSYFVEEFLGYGE